MTIRNRLTRRILFTGGATALTIGATAGVALAVAITFSISPGGAITAKAGKTTLKDTTTAQTLSCTSSSSSATLKSGHGISGTNLGSITALSFNNCTGPGGFTFTVSDSGFPWTLSGASFNASSGVTTGHISGIFAHLSGPSCTADIAGKTATTGGQVKVTYTNSTHKLRVFPGGGTLHIWNVSGCFTLINTGDASQFTGTYTVSPAQTITSP
jgi:hypothetical protein